MRSSTCSSPTDTHQPGARPRLGRHRPVDRRRQVLHQRVHPAERDRVGGQLARLHEPRRGLVYPPASSRARRSAAGQLPSSTPRGSCPGSPRVEHARRPPRARRGAGPARPPSPAAHGPAAAACAGRGGAGRRRTGAGSRRSARTWRRRRPSPRRGPPRPPPRRRGRPGTWSRCAAPAPPRAGPAAGGQGWRRCCRRAPGRRPPGTGLEVDQVADRVRRRLHHDEPGSTAKRDLVLVLAPGHRGPEQAGGEDVVGAAVQRAERDDVRPAALVARGRAGAQRASPTRTPPRAWCSSSTQAPTRTGPRRTCHRRW